MNLNVWQLYGGRTTETRHAGIKQEVTPPKRGSSLLNYLDQTQTREFGSEEECYSTLYLLLVAKLVANQWTRSWGGINP